MLDRRRHVGMYWRECDLVTWQRFQSNCETNIPLTQERYAKEKWEDTRARYDDHDYVYDGVD